MTSSPNQGSPRKDDGPDQQRTEKYAKSEKINTLSSFTWSIAESLRGDFKQSEYGKVILPFVVLRRLDCLLEPTKDAVLKIAKGLPQGIDDETRDMILAEAAGENLRVYNTSRFTDYSFTDFLLSRILETRGTQPGEIEADADAGKTGQMILEIGPHPDLSDTQQTLIAFDHGMTGGKAGIPVRKALLQRAPRRPGPNADPAARRPQDQQVVLPGRDAAVPSSMRQDNGEARA